MYQSQEVMCTQGKDHALEIAGIGPIKIKMFGGVARTIQDSCFGVRWYWNYKDKGV